MTWQCPCPLCNGLAEPEYPDDDNLIADILDAFEQFDTLEERDAEREGFPDDD